MSDTNRTQVAIARYSNRDIPLPYNQTGPNANAFDLLRFTGTPNLSFTPQTEVSNEIRPDRQISDLILVGGSASGDIGFELSFNAFDTLIENALFAQFAQANPVPVKSGAAEVTGIGAGTIDVDAADSLSVGHIIRLEGVDKNNGDALRDGVYEVTNKLVNTITVAQHSGQATLTSGPGADLSEAKVTVCGIIAQANGEISAAAPVADVATVTFGGASLALLQNAMGVGLSLVPGQHIKLGHTRLDAPVPTQRFTIPDNNVFARILAIDTTAGTVSFSAPDGFLADAASGARVAVYFGDHLPNPSQPGAISDYQLAIERSYLDHTPISRELFLGMTLNTLQLQLNPQSIVTGTASFIGFRSHARSETDIDQLYQAPVNIVRRPSPAFDVYNTSSNIGRLGFGPNNICKQGVNLVTEASININNNLRERDAVCVFGAASIGAGELNSSGSVNTYFDNLDLYNKVLENEDTSLDLGFRDTTGRTVIVDQPRIKFSDGAPDIPGKNQDVPLPLTYQAILSPTLGYTISFQRMSFAG